MNTDIKIGKQLNDKFGRKFYKAAWIPPTKEPSIVMLIMDEETARHEVPFYLQLNSHAHVIHTFGLVRNNPRSTILVQERAPYGNLQLLLQNRQFEPSGNVLVPIFLQIIDAMIYMTDQNIVHGNLCCENVLVFQMDLLKPEKSLIKLTNFNQARRRDSSFVDERCRTIPIRYCAPEILQNPDQSNDSELSEVYSMGVLMWEACSKGTIPYGSIKNDNDVRQCRLNGKKLSQPRECLKQIWNVIQDCWHMEPELRYNFREIQTLLSVIYATCPHCRNQYLANDMAIHQRSCPPATVREQHKKSDQKLPSKKTEHPPALSEASITPTTTLVNKASNEAQPSTPKASKSLLHRIRSWFGRKQ